MDNEQLSEWTEEVFARASGTAVVEGSAPEAASASSEPVPAAVEAVAPAEPAANAESSTPAAPTADPNTERLEALEREIAANKEQLAAAAEKAQQWDQLTQLAAQRQEQERRDQRVEGWKERALSIENLPTDLQKVESARLVAEIEAEIAAENQKRYQPQIQQAHADVESTAAIASGIFNALMNDPEVSDAAKARIVENGQFLSGLPTPDAQIKTVERDKRLIEAAVTAARAQWESTNATATAERVQERIEQATDVVGSATGPAGNGDDGSIAFAINRAYEARRTA